MTEKLPPLEDSDKMLSWSHDTFAALSGEGAKEVKELIMDSMRNAVPESVWRGIDLSSGSCAIRGDDNVMRAFLGDILVLVCIWCRETVATYITVAHLQVRPNPPLVHCCLNGHVHRRIPHPYAHFGVRWNPPFRFLPLDPLWR